MRLIDRRRTVDNGVGFVGVVVVVFGLAGLAEDGNQMEQLPMVGNKVEQDYASGVCECLDSLADKLDDKIVIQQLSILYLRVYLGLQKIMLSICRISCNEGLYQLDHTNEVIAILIADLFGYRLFVTLILAQHTYDHLLLSLLKL